MKIAGSSLLYSRESLSTACERLATLGFEYIDVGVLEGWAHVDPSEVVGNVDATADRIATVCSRADLEPVAFNASAGDVDIGEERSRITALAALASQLGVDVLTLPAASSDADLETDIDRFRTLVDAVDDYDVTLTVETHVNTHPEDPETATRYAESIPGFGLTLDPSHFAVGPHWGPTVLDELLGHVDHLHVRQAGSEPDELQRPVEDGRIDFETLFSDLERVGYDGVASVEYIDSMAETDPDEGERNAESMLTHLESIR